MTRPKQRSARLWWAVFFLALAVVVAVVICPRGEEEYVYPAAPSTWDASSMMLVVPTPDPNPFPINFEDFVKLAQSQEGWETEPYCEFEPDNNHCSYCEFEGQGFTMFVDGHAGSGLESIRFEFNRYDLSAGIQMFNRIVWEAGLEKQAQRARELVDTEMGKEDYITAIVNRILVRVYFVDLQDKFLAIEFMEW